MAQYVKQANIFGRLGSGVGKGLAEQVPKEIERNRLQSGLEDVANNSEGLTPFQRFAKLSGVPGITPQAIQSGSELLRQEAIRNSFRNQPGQGEAPQASAQTAPGGQGGGQPGMPNMPADKVNRSVVQGGESIPTNFATRGAEAAANQGLVKENPAQKKFIPAIPWTQQQRDNNLGRLGERHPELTFEQLNQLNADDERRYLEAPEAYRKQQDYLNHVEDQADSEFDKQLETILQKKGSDIYGDLTGETLLDVKKAMRHDLATDPTLTPKGAAEKWVKKGKDFVDAKNEVKKLANRDLWDRFAPNKKESALKALKEAQKSFSEMGRQREFSNILQSKNTDEGGYGFGLSPGAAALIAYPRSDSIKKVMKDNTIISVPQNEFYQSQHSRKLADEFYKSKTNGDSILAFTRSMQAQDPNFNSQVFIDYLRDNKDYEFSPDQNLELKRPYEDYFSNWGDLALFPYSGRSAAHD